MAGVLYGQLEFQINRLQEFLDAGITCQGTISWRLIELGRAHKALAKAVPDDLSADLNDLKYDANTLAIKVSKASSIESLRAEIVEFIKTSREMLSKIKVTNGL